MRKTGKRGIVLPPHSMVDGGIVLPPHSMVDGGIFSVSTMRAAYPASCRPHALLPKDVTMDWQSYYQARCMTADSAASLIRSGQNILYGHAVGEPSAFSAALVRNKDALENVGIIHMVCMGSGAYCAPDMAPHFHHTAMFVGSRTREAVASGQGDFIPTHLSQVPHLIRSGLLPLDVFACQVSPPDAHGYVSLGVSVDYGKAAVAAAPVVIAQVNAHMPRTMGDSFVHVSEIDHFIEHSAPLIELPRPQISETETRIGRHIAALIDDGATLQLGIGSLPDATLMFLRDKNDLGIHSEMISDGVMALMQAGVITGKRKSLYPNKAVVTFLMGTRALYDYVDSNPAFLALPADQVNDPALIGQNDAMVAVNSCVQVDLYGQIASESVGDVQISGTGGQVDFIRGAARSKGGKAVIAIPSTARNNTVSKIVPSLDPGAAVTTLRTDVDHIVTEYGVAALRGKTLRDRAKALINIAHPDFQPELIKEYDRRFSAQR